MSDGRSRAALLFAEPSTKDIHTLRTIYESELENCVVLLNSLQSAAEILDDDDIRKITKGVQDAVSTTRAAMLQLPKSVRRQIRDKERAMTTRSRSRTLHAGAAQDDMGPVTLHALGEASAPSSQMTLQAGMSASAPSASQATLQTGMSASSPPQRATSVRSKRARRDRLRHQLRRAFSATSPVPPALVRGYIAWWKQQQQMADALLDDVKPDFLIGAEWLLMHRADILQDAHVLTCLHHWLINMDYTYWDVDKEIVAIRQIQRRRAKRVLPSGWSTSPLCMATTSFAAPVAVQTGNSLTCRQPHSLSPSIVRQANSFSHSPRSTAESVQLHHQQPGRAVDRMSRQTTQPRPREYNSYHYQPTSVSPSAPSPVPVEYAPRVRLVDRDSLRRIRPP